jgi:hypothetical protein
VPRPASSFASVSPDGAVNLRPGQLPDKPRLPDPVRPREMQQEQFPRDMELDPEDFNPPDADRDISTQWPEEGVEMDVETLLRAKGVEPDEND